MRTLDGTNSAQVTEQINALNINVLYPPVITQLTSNGKNIDMIYSAIKTLRGDNINIVCTSDANPPATVLWRDQLIPSPTLNVTSVQYDAVWTCQASNSMTEYDGVASTSSVTKTVSVSVLYGPGVPIITYRILPNSDERWNVPNGLIRVVVGRTIMCMCSVDSFPASTYTWNTGHERSIQTIANVTRTTNTTYICTTRNFMDTSFKGSAVGSNSSSVNIDVLYGPASIALKYNNVTSIGHALPVIKGWSFTLLCSAISNPAPRYAWSGPVDQEGDVLIIRNVTNDTNRNVTCRAENTMVDSVGKRVIGTAQVAVLIELLYSPDVQRLQNQTVLLNTSFTVLCNLTDVGNPPASNFSWIRRDNQTVVGTGKTLTLNNIGLADEGEYQCNASNRMQSIGNEVVYGFSQSTFFINVGSIPETPQNVHVSQKGITELELQWIPGFNGGAEQTFQIIYKKINIESWTETHAPANNTRHTLSGLSAGTAYRCKMRAENIYGISPWTEDITVYTLLENDSQSSTLSAVGGAVGGVIGCIAIIAVAIGVYRYRFHDLALPTFCIWDNVRRSLQRKRRQCETYDNLDTDTYTIRYYDDIVREKRNLADTSSGSYETYDFGNVVQQRQANTYTTFPGVEMRELTGPPNDILQDSQALAKEEIASFSFEPKLIGEEEDYVNIKLSGL
ncbi:protein turtle-like [Dreissena polymorpha]|nr:protein turtle-like [Dreissena polymorpha]